ncbi:MAG TPA: molybdopterin-dependent oxidoreductase [Desulfatiglandales bacterium]|nr:molybdopterin-dependent oxidoreductase [Desulfatiglandales bacterium]
MRKITLRRFSGAGNIILAIVFLGMVLPSTTFAATENLDAKSESGTDKTPGMAVSPKPCNPSPITVPVKPEVIPGYTELDPATGLHVTGTIPEINFESYRLEVSGKVSHPLSLSYDELRCMPRIEARPDLICPGFFTDVATWAGASLEHVLELAGVQAGAKEIRLISAERYHSLMSLEQARSGSNFLAYELEGKPLPILHGFPVRAVFPELEGNTWVKWLVKIEVN